MGASKKKALTKDQILNASTRTYEYVNVPEWGGPIRLRSLTGKERDDFETSVQDDGPRRGGRKGKGNTANFRARLIALCAVDDDGEPLFSNRYEVSLLGEQSAKALQTVFDVCAAMNGFTDEDVASMVEDFEPEDGEASTSD